MLFSQFACNRSAEKDIAQQKVEINFEYLFVIKFVPQKSIVKFREKFNKKDCLLEFRVRIMLAIGFEFWNLLGIFGAGA